MQNPATDKEDIVKTTKTSISGTKNEEPNHYYLRRGNLNKQLVAQHGTYLDLWNVPFKDQEQTIHD